MGEGSAKSDARAGTMGDGYEGSVGGELQYGERGIVGDVARLVTDENVAFGVSRVLSHLTPFALQRFGAP